MPIRQRESRPATRAAVALPGPTEHSSIMLAIEALGERADAAGLLVTAARLRALHKLARAELVEVRLGTLKYTNGLTP